MDQTRFKRLIVMNTFLPTGEPAGKGFNDWRDFCNRSPDMDVGRVIARGTPHLTPAEVEAYNAPFPSPAHKAGVRRFPNIVMTDPEMQGVDVSKRAKAMYETSDKFKAEDVFVAVGMKDPVLGPPMMRQLVKMWKNGYMWTEVSEAGHFVQEWGEEVARKVIEAFETHRMPDGVTRKQGRGSKL